MIVDSNHVFICVLSDEEIAKIRKCQQYYPVDSFMNVLTGLALEAADRRIEDAEMIERMNEEYEKSEKDSLWESRAYIL